VERLMENPPNLATVSKSTRLGGREPKHDGPNG